MRTRAILLFMALLSCSARGTIINGGFETGDWTGWEPPDWEVIGTEGIEVTSSVQNNGQYSRLIFHDGQANRYNDFYQNIDISGGYTHLSFWVNVDLNPNGDYNPGSWAGVDIRTHNHGDVVANLVTFGGTTPGHYGTDGWEGYEFELGEYTDLEQVTLTFWLETGNNLSLANQRIYVDDVALVPEPVTVLLLGLGGLGALRRCKG